MDNRQVTYSRDEIYIEGLNQSINKIEEIESSIYLNKMQIYPYFARISALYSKCNNYISDEYCKEKLYKIRKMLYNDNFVRDFKNNQNKINLNTTFYQIFDELVELYRQFSIDFSNLGLTPKVIQKKIKRSQDETLTPEQKEELEALEEIGLM